MGAKGIKEAYATGRGKIYVRARAEIVETKGDRFKIVVTEIPYGVNKARLIQRIADLVKEKRLEGVADVQDYSDRKGMHIEVTVKRDANAQVVLNNLYKMTDMQVTFGTIMLALDDGVPKILTLKQILQKYIAFQEEIVRRRTQFDLKKAQDRAHILEGLAKAIDIVDDVIATIRACKGGQAEAKQAIMDKFGKVAMIAPVTDDNDVIMITTDGIVIRTHADQINTVSRPGKGVKVMRVKDGEKLATLGIVDRFVEEDDEEVENTEVVAEDNENAN